MDFKEAILKEFPDFLPAKKDYDLSANHAPKRKRYSFLVGKEKN